MSFTFGKKSLKSLDGVHPNLVLCAKKALGYGVLDFTITDGVRTKAQQEALYQQGRSEPGPIVTWTMHSYHLPQGDGYGHAIDIAPYIDGSLEYDKPSEFYKLASLMFRAAMELGIEIEWGGFWKKRDMPHFQLKGD